MAPSVNLVIAVFHLDNGQSVPIFGNIQRRGPKADRDDLHQDAVIDSRAEGGCSEILAARHSISKKEHEARNRLLAAVVRKLKSYHINGEVHIGAALGDEREATLDLGLKVVHVIHKRRNKAGFVAELYDA